VTLRRIHLDVYVSIMSDAGGEALNAAALEPAKGGIEARGGQVSIGHFEGSVTVTVDVPGERAEDVPHVVQLQRSPEQETEFEGLDFGPGSDDDEAGADSGVA
jgi:hypothetical protein